MDIIANALFIAEIVLIWAILTVIQFPIRKEEHRVIRTIVFLLKLILVPLIAILSVSIDWRMAYTYNDLLLAFYVALIGDIVASVIEYLVRRVRTSVDGNDDLRHRFDNRIGIPLGLSVCIIVLVLSSVYAETMHMDVHQWQADGLEQEHTFAFAADLHVGSSLSADSLMDFCRQINESDAEFLILGGDITDELTSYESMIDTYRILSTIHIPIYLIYGNHDRQPCADYVGGRTYSDEQLLNAIENAGITLLKDEYVQVASDLVLLGREDISVGDARKDYTELVNPFTTGALIVADHQPFDEEQLENGIFALQLSGHTHAGQIWPLMAIYSMLHLPVYGEYGYPGTLLYVTPGLCGWAPPVRTEAHSGWELITLCP